MPDIGRPTFSDRAVEYGIRCRVPVNSFAKNNVKCFVSNTDAYRSGVRFRQNSLRVLQRARERDPQHLTSRCIFLGDHIEVITVDAKVRNFIRKIRELPPVRSATLYSTLQTHVDQTFTADSVVNNSKSPPGSGWHLD